MHNEFKVKYLEKIEKVISEGPYQDTWESLTDYNVPDWFRDAKFGIFIHWGVYSVPAFESEWYPKFMYDKTRASYHHHLETYGEHKFFGYKDFIPMFKAERFNPDQWCDIFKRSGARYIVPVGEHHDGFQMYKSEVSHWNSVEMGPHRDVIGELFDSSQNCSLIQGISSHRAEHWFFMSHARDFESGADCDNPNSIYYPSIQIDDHVTNHSLPQPSKEYMEDWLIRTCEIVDRYHPRLVYFDWWIEQESFKPYLRKFLAYYYNCAHKWNIEVVVNYKHDAMAFGSAVLDIERGQFAELVHFPWQTCTSMGRKSWGYIVDNEFKDSEELLQDLVDIVSKNGNMLLNIGPKSDGSFTNEELKILDDMGKWLKINGEAIFGSRPWRFFGEGETKVADGGFSDGKKKIYTSSDIRYTVNKDNIYAIALKRSSDGRYCLKRMRKTNPLCGTVFFGIVDRIVCLEDGNTYPFQIDEEGLHISGPANSNQNNPICFKIILK